MNNNCEICGEFNSGDNWVEKIKDEKDSVEINGHYQCVADLHDKVKSIKNLDKKNVQLVLKEINFKSL